MENGEYQPLSWKLFLGLFTFVFILGLIKDGSAFQLLEQIGGVFKW